VFSQVRTRGAFPRYGRSLSGLFFPAIRAIRPGPNGPAATGYREPPGTRRAGHSTPALPGAPAEGMVAAQDRELAGPGDRDRGQRIAGRVSGAAAEAGQAGACAVLANDVNRQHGPTVQIPKIFPDSGAGVPSFRESSPGRLVNMQHLAGLALFSRTRAPADLFGPRGEAGAGGLASTASTSRRKTRATCSREEKKRSDEVSGQFGAPASSPPVSRGLVAPAGPDGEREPLSGGLVVGVREAGTVQIPKILTDSGG
jgi:hypothetical protein